MSAATSPGRSLLRVGLSGGLGAGKSTVGRMLAGRGAYVIDTDEVARVVLGPGTEGERAVLQRFGPEVRGADGTLDRRALARRVFSAPAERLALEAIAHPLIREVVEARLAAAAAGTREPSLGLSPPHLAVLEIPLLDWSRRRQYRLDVVVLIEAPAELALRRAVERGFSEAEARARLAAQPSAADRRAAADRVLSNSGDLHQLEASVSELWRWLSQLAQSRMETS